MADPKYFKTDAKAIVDGFFDAKLFKEEITRDDMNNVEDFIAEMMQSKFDSHLKMTELANRIKKNLK